MLGRLLFIWLTILVSGQLAAAPLMLDQHQDGLYLGRHLSICPEQVVPSSMEEIHRNWDKLPCTVQAVDIPFLNLGEGAYWFHLQVQHDGSEARSMVLEHNWPTDLIRIVHVLPSGQSTTSSFGSEVFASPEIMHRYPAQRITFQPGLQDIYIYMKHVGSIRLPLRLWTEQSFQHNKYREDIAAAILVGVTMAMVLYNIFLFVTFRFKQQVYYVGFLIATFSYLLFWSGFAQNIPAPYRFFFSKTWVAASSLMCFFLCHFTIQFLSLDAQAPRLAKVLRIFSWAFALNAGLEMFHRAGSFMVFSVLLTPFLLICIGAGCRGVWQGGRPAIFYLLSFLLVILGGTLENTIAMGMVDPKWSFWPFFAASNLQSILLSLAIGDKLYLDHKQSHGKIVALNSELQEHVHHVNELVNRKTREIRSIMTNLPQGLLMIQKDLTIHRDYSSFCTQLFEQNDLGGRAALAIVFQGMQLGTDRLAQVQSALEACLGESDITFQLNESCFPLEGRRLTRQGEQQILEMGWHPIVDAAGQIEYILLSVRDVTSLRKLQMQSDKQMQRLEMIGEIINIDHTGFLRFMKSCRAFQAENQRLLQNLQQYDPEINKILFINLHTMKGLARSLHLTRIADIYHNIEQYLADMRMGQVEFSHERLLKSFQDIEDQLDTYESVSTHDLGRSMKVNEHALVPMKDLEPLVQRIDRLDINDAKATKTFVADVRNLFTHLYFQAPARVFTDIFAGLPRLAKDLAKDVPSVQLNLGEVLITHEAEDLFRNVFVHLLRNSMDHGIENSAERVKKGKVGRGLIQVQLTIEGDALAIDYSDDGRGLDLKAISNAAIRRGLLRADTNPKLDELVAFIFTSGFTTSHTVSEISGRGVGMDAVSRYIQDQGGTIQVRFPAMVDSSWTYIPFSFHITLPSRFFYREAVAA